jgi:hypothetical protein
MAAARDSDSAPGLFRALSAPKTGVAMPRARARLSKKTQIAKVVEDRDIGIFLSVDEVCKRLRHERSLPVKYVIVHIENLLEIYINLKEKAIIICLANDY